MQLYCLQIGRIMENFYHRFLSVRFGLRHIHARKYGIGVGRILRPYPMIDAERKDLSGYAARRATAADALPTALLGSVTELDHVPRVEPVGHLAVMDNSR